MASSDVRTFQKINNDFNFYNIDYENFRGSSN